MSELARYQFHRHAGAEVLDRPMVATVVKAKQWEAECAEPFAVIVGHLPAVDAAEQALARRERGEMTLDVRPGPIRDVSQPVAVPGLGATCAKRACGVGHVALGAGENGA